MQVIGRQVRVASGVVHVREDGPADGPVVVLLHGFASSLHSFDRLAPLLSADCRVVRVDLLGHGESSGSSRYDSRHQAAMVVEVLDRLGVAPGVVVGHSLGADVAIDVAERSGYALRLVVIGQAPDYSSARIPRGSRVICNRAVGPVVRRFTPGFVVRRVARFAFAPGVRAELLFDHRGRIVQDFRATRAEVYRAVLVDRPRLLAAQPLDAQLRSLELPTLVILGAQDQLYPHAPTLARYAALAQARVETLSQSGHSPVLEQPEETARLIRRFVPEQPAG